MLSVLSADYFIANSLDPELLAWSGSKLFNTDGIPERYFENVSFEKKNQQTAKKHAKLPSMQRIRYEPRCEKTGLRGFRPGSTQTGL